MTRRDRPHLLGVDDGPFEKDQLDRVRVVGVMMEGHDLVEAVATTEFPVDGDGAAGFLAAWIGGLRLAPALHGVVLGGISIAGLGIVDVSALAATLGIPVLVVNRQAPRDDRLRDALVAAGLAARIEIVERSPPARRIDEGLHLSCAGIGEDDAERLVRLVRHKSQLPEPLRVAHLIAAALTSGESRGRP